MKNSLPQLISFYLLLAASPMNAQTIAPDILQKQWDARWITVPDASPNGYGVYLFRKVLTFPDKPSTFVIHVSADNRYKLFVNEKLVSLGPARGDINH